METKQIITITIPPELDLLVLCGSCDDKLRLIEKYFDVIISLNENELKITGPLSDISACRRLFDSIILQLHVENKLTKQTLLQLIQTVKNSEMLPLSFKNDVVFSHKGKVIRPKTSGQKRFVDAITTHSITFGLGPAGTGKTYLACACALAALKRKEIGRIILSRPIVEAGESLGFLPGTIMEKVDPYIRPLYDALFDLMDTEKAYEAINQGIIEITPLAFMRGRSFNDSFIILDEAQNTSAEQMKMFLTRLGFGSKMIITGDESQSDSPSGPTGIRSAKTHLIDIEDIAFCQLKNSDVVRNPLVAQIVAAYENSSATS